MKFNLDNLADEYAHLEKELSDPEVFKDQKKVRDLSSRKKQLEEPVSLYNQYKNAFASVEEAESILTTETDEEFLELAKLQKEESLESIETLEEKHVTRETVL